jgi:hypothetical protein
MNKWQSRAKFSTYLNTVIVLNVGSHSMKIEIILFVFYNGNVCKIILITNDTRYRFRKIIYSLLWKRFIL